MQEGTPFGRYQLLDLIGRGGMGEVWRAHDTVTDRVIALKVLPEHLSQDDTFRQRFLREAHSAAKLNEPHVVPIHTFGEIDGRLFVDMRVIEGRDLHTLLNQGPLDPVRAVLIIEQIAHALHAAHTVGLVHRDVKPSNILVTDNDFAYLIDFGIARGIDQPGLTDTGAMIGTWHYMAPERLRAEAVDSRSDVYALACVLHECLTGNYPFPGDSVESQIAAHLTSPPPKPSITRSDVSSQFDAVVAEGMAKSPDERYSTTIELAHAARAIIGELSSPRVAVPPAPTTGASPFDPTSAAPAPDARQRDSTHRDSAPPRWRRKKVLLPLAALLVGIVAVAVAVPFVLRGDQRQTTLAFNNLTGPYGVAVAADGTVFASDSSDRVLRLPAGTSTPSQLPFTRLIAPFGAAVDADGNVYVADAGRDRVFKLANGATTAEEMPFGGLEGPTDVDVGPDGTVYVADAGNDRVLALAPNAGSPTVLPFAGIDNPVSVAVGGDGTVVVVDAAHNRVVELQSDQERQLAFTALTNPSGVAIGPEGTVYVADKDNNRVLSLDQDAGEPEQLAFTDLRGPQGVALGPEGTVYVADSGNSRVLALAAD